MIIRIVADLVTCSITFYTSHPLCPDDWFPAFSIEGKQIKQFGELFLQCVKELEAGMPKAIMDYVNSMDKIDKLTPG